MCHYKLKNLDLQFYKTNMDICSVTESNERLLLISWKNHTVHFDGLKITACKNSKHESSVRSNRVDIKYYRQPPFPNTQQQQKTT